MCLIVAGRYFLEILMTTGHNPFPFGMIENQNCKDPYHLAHPHIVEKGKLSVKRVSGTDL